jgi:3',5'-cyclic-AMP phosphodiesterase
VRIVQISDTHIFEDPKAALLGVNTAKSFEAVLNLIAENPVPPDIIVLTGDLSQDETEAAYLYVAKSCERFSCPIYWLPGNHDVPDVMQKTFAKTQFKEDKAILLGSWLLILLNTHYPKHVPGMLGRSELSRLAYFLSEHPDQHALVFMHHQPVPVGSQWLDNLGLLNAADFFAITDKYPQIRGIIFGHVHQAFETHRQGVPILSAPSTSVQFLPGQEKFALDLINPGYRWFDLNPDGTFKTGVERVVNFDNTVDLSSEGY